MIQVIKEILEKAGSNGYPKERYELARGYLIGSYPFKFQTSASYLGQLTFLDHLGLPYKRLYDFPDIVKKFSQKDISGEINNIFKWNELDVVVVGSKKLVDQLKKFGKVKVLPYKKFL